MHKLLFISLGLILANVSTAQASTFDYPVRFNIDPSDVVSGSIVTDCRHCILDSTDVVSWSFTLNGALAFSSSDATAVIYTRGILSPLTAFGNRMVYTPSDSLGVLEFCVGSIGSPCNFPTLGLAFIDEGVNVIEYIERVGNNSEVAPGFSGEGLTNPVAISSVPEPSTWALLLMGLTTVGFMAYRRKATAISAA